MTYDDRIRIDQINYFTHLSGINSINIGSYCCFNVNSGIENGNVIEFMLSKTLGYNSLSRFLQTTTATQKGRRKFCILRT